MGQLAERRGFHRDFFEPYKVTHLAVEGNIPEVTRTLTACGEYFRPSAEERLGALEDLLGKPHEDAKDLAMVFQLKGNPWTQVFADIRSVRGLELAQRLSAELETRVLCIELTDDAYNTYGLFESGRVEELDVNAVDQDLSGILSGLKMEAPASLADADPEDPEEIEYFFSAADKERPENALELLVKELGIYLHCIYLTDEATYGLQDAEPRDVVRLDMIVALPQEESASS